MTARRSRLKVMLAVTSVAVAAAACGSSSTKVAGTTIAPTTTTSSVPSGFTAFRDQTDRFTIAVPSSWRKIDPSSPGAAQGITDLEAQNPSFKTVFGNGPADLVAKGMKYLAVGAPGSTNYAPTINVITKPAVGARDSDLPGLVDSVKAEYTSIGATFLSSATVTLAGHQALQVKLQLPLRLPSGTTLRLPETQDLVAANDFLYIVTLAGTSSDFPTIESTFSVC